MRAFWVVMGAACGSSLRYGVNEAVGMGHGGWPWATLVVNLTGAAVLGGLIGLAGDRLWRPGSRLRLFLSVGLLGSYTTFSALAVEVDQLIEAGRVGTGLAYLAASVGGGLAVARAGTALGRRAR